MFDIWKVLCYRTYLIDSFQSPYLNWNFMVFLGGKYFTSYKNI